MGIGQIAQKYRLGVLAFETKGIASGYAKETGQLKHFPDLPPIWMLCAMAFSWALSQVAPILSVSSLGLRWLGLFWILLAAMLVLWSAFWFWRKKTSIEPRKSAKTLIVSGPFWLSRNPIYLAMVVAAAGVALYLATLSAFVPVIALAVVLHHRFVLPEEAGLKAVFGGAADAYFEKTRRWI